MQFRPTWLYCSAFLAFFSGSYASAGHFTLAFQRQLPAWENSAGTGCMGTHVCRAWVWDENGHVMPNIQLKTSWGILMATTDIDGRAQFPTNMGDDFDLMCADGASTSDVARLMTTNRPECWGHYSFEVGFMYKTDVSNPGEFDLSLHGTWNERTPAPQDEDVPYTKSLAYNGVDYRDYWSDQSYWGNWQDPPSYFGQTFVATANRVVAARVQGTIGGNDLLDWNLQVLSFPDLTPVGLSTSVPVRWPFGWEAYWGVNDCPVVPGRTYMLKVWRTGGGMNIWHVTRNVYPDGQYYEGTRAVPEFDLNGHICCMNYEDAPRQGLAGLWEMGDPSTSPWVDAGSQGRNGTAQGNPQIIANGRFGNAVRMDGSDSVTIVGYKGIRGAAARTCAAWVRVAPAVTNAPLLRWGPMEAGRLWLIKIAPVGQAGVFRVMINGGYMYSTRPVNTNQWTHLAVVLPDEADDTTDLRLYINGRREPAANLVMSGYRINSAVTEDVRIGTSGAEFLVGDIDDVAILDVPLSDDQIAQLYALGGRSFLRPCGGPMFDGAVGRAVDIDRNCYVTLTDMALLSDAWLAGGLLAGDVTADDAVNLADLLVVAGDWLRAVGLAGHWTFNQSGGATAFDSSGNNRHGVLLNMQDDDWVAGRMGNALAFDGTDDYIEVTGYSGIAGNHARTCCAWIKTTAAPAPIIWWGNSNISGATWDFRVNSLGQLRLQVGGGGVASSLPVNTGQWVHVAAVLPDGRDNTEDVQLYVNGVHQPGGSLAPHGVNTATQPAVRIGSDGTGRWFLGLIDDARIYSRALSPAEVAALANSN